MVATCLSDLPLRPSSPPAAPPLRAKHLGKLRNPKRVEARKYGAKSLYAAARGVSDGELGREVSLTREEGACVRTGALVLTTAEAGLLLPFEVSVRHLVDVLKERHVRESLDGDGESPEAQLCLRLAIALLDIVVACREQTPAALFEQMLAGVRDYIVRQSSALGASDSAVDRERALRLRLGLAHVDALLVTLL